MFALKRLCIGIAFGLPAVLGLPTISAQAQRNLNDVVTQMIANERTAAANKNNYIYTANERSERTGLHLWTERVCETPFGRVRYLLSEDGKPLPPDRIKQEQDRLANDAAHPEPFIKKEKVLANDETHGRALLELLPKAYILENLREQNGELRIDFRPNPAYSPANTEEKIMHGMSGYLLIHEQQLRLRYIEGRLPQDLSIGFGFVTVRAGSYFLTDKAPFEGQWRTVKVISDVQAKAMLLKSITRNQDVARRDFSRVDNNLTVAQAVALVEK